MNPGKSGDTEALAELIAAIGAARQGSADLDIKIEYCVGVAFDQRTDVAGILIEEGFSWDTVGAALEDRVPPYTTSLDASAPGENVVFVIRSDRRGKWGAVHRSEDGREHLAWAATECMARRLAGLSGRYAMLTRERSTATEEARVEVVPDRDWKVMF